MKELNSFTVDRLKDLINQYVHEEYNDVSDEDVIKLVSIALAAKRAEPVAWTSQRSLETKNKIVAFTDDMSALDYGTANGWADIVELYTTPQLNSPEIPEDWKLVPIIAYPSQWAAGQKAHNSAGINKVDAVYKAMVAAAPDASGFDPSLPGAEATVITHYYTPDGYKLVPTEITKSMRDAWDSAPNGHEDDDVNMCNAYRAMIAAAPEKPL